MTKIRADEIFGPTKIWADIVWADKVHMSFAVFKILKITHDSVEIASFGCPIYYQSTGDGEEKHGGFHVSIVLYCCFVYDLSRNTRLYHQFFPLLYRNTGKTPEQFQKELVLGCILSVNRISTYKNNPCIDGKLIIRPPLSNATKKIIRS